MSAPTPDQHSLFVQLDSIAQLSARDRTALAALPNRGKSILAGRDIKRDGGGPGDLCIVTAGLVGRYIMLSNGRRQILSLHFPGDIPDLEGLHLGRATHSLFALTPVQLDFISCDAMRKLMRDNQRVDTAIARHLAISGVIAREWIANAGRRSAVERIAHLVCECFARMQAVGLVLRTPFVLPLTLAEIGDATGLSSVHVNRTVKEMRRQGLLGLVNRAHTILNWDLLSEAADFDPRYLHFRSPQPAPGR